MGFFGRLKREIWKVVRGILILGIVITIVISLVNYGRKITGPESIAMIIDSDSGNEMDDLFAINLALIDPRIEVTGLLSSHFYNHPTAGDSSLELSHAINQELISQYITNLNPDNLPGSSTTNPSASTRSSSNRSSSNQSTSTRSSSARSSSNQSTSTRSSSARSSTNRSSSNQSESSSTLDSASSSPIPVLKGARGPIGYWGDLKPQPSPAAQFIIDQANALGFKEKLNVVTMGSVTNLATAILMDSTIVPKITWYAMALKYDDRTQVWNKNEFNVRNDLDGMDFLLNREGLESHIMTATTSSAYQFERTETFDLLEGRGPQWDMLVDRWNQVAPEARNWTMWDLALIQAIMNPELVTEKEVWGPPENIRKRIFVYTHIDAVKMRREYRKLVRKAMQDISSDIE